MKKVIGLFVGCLLASLLCGQSLRPLSIGLEGQVYPTGIIPGLRLDWQLANQGTGHLRLGANIIDHQDFGEQDEEIGEGFGFSLGYQYFFQPELKGFFLGARCDLWWNTLDWRNNIGEANEERGTTNITVLQPTLLGGYSWLLGGGWEIAPTVAFGIEVNVITKGEPVGQGTILLGGLTLGKRF